MGSFLFLLLGVTFCCYGVRGRSISNRGLDLDGRNMIQDKPAVNMIPSSDADEYECVDIYKQPALDHPLLKNHKVQMNPRFSTKWTTDEALSKITLAEMNVPGGGCPEGMVPIQRTKVKDQTQLKSFSKPHGGSFQTLSSSYPGEHSATLDTSKSSSYHGARALIAIWNPHVEVNQYSKSQIWVRNGPDAETNSIEVGWAVHPALYGDNRTRFTTYWTADGYQKTGCYNAQCAGFVQVHPTYFPGAPFDQISVPGGPQYAFDVAITQDPSTGNWWLMSPNNTQIGYWPKELFTHLATEATSARYGGATFSPPDIPTPVPMGNGALPDRFPMKAGFIARIQIVNEDNQMVDVDPGMVVKFIDDPNQCYSVLYFGDQHDPYSRQAITFGGPGGNCT